MIRFLIFLLLFALGVAGLYKLVEWMFDINIWVAMNKSLKWKDSREKEAEKEVEDMWKGDKK
jgi:hypothetical protein